MMEGWLCPRCHKVNAPWVSQCSCEDFWRDKITCNPCTTGAYPRDNSNVLDSWGYNHVGECDCVGHLYSDELGIILYGIHYTGVC